jgi:hypothetical protein
MPQAPRTTPEARRWRYSHGAIERCRPDRGGVAHHSRRPFGAVLSLGAFIATPPVSCGVGHPTTYQVDITLLAGLSMVAALTGRLAASRYCQGGLVSPANNCSWSYAASEQLRDLGVGHLLSRRQAQEGEGVRRHVGANPAGHHDGDPDLGRDHAQLLDERLGEAPDRETGRADRAAWLPGAGVSEANLERTRSRRDDGACMGASWRRGAVGDHPSSGQPSGSDRALV